MGRSALDLDHWWEVDPKPVTEEVAQAACDLGKNLPDDVGGGVEVDTVTGAVTAVGTEACIAPGMPDDEDECDWSAGDLDVEVVQAFPAQVPDPKVETKGEDAEAEPMDAEGRGEGVTVSGEAEKDTVMEDPEASEPHKGVEMLTPKAEEIIEEGGAPLRRRKIKFGNAHLRILRAVADADASNWESLQKVIGATPASAREKSEFFGRLEQLADLRVQSLVAAEKRAQEHAERVKHYTEAESQYQSGLNDAMLRLERMNPVGPRASVPLISDARLREDIAAGKSMWQARREHRSRARAAQHRKETAEKPTLDPSQPNRLTEVPPAEGGGVLNKAFSESAKANLKEFRQILREEAQVEATIKKRKPDSERRKKIKKDRRKEKKSNTKDDAERDHNHAIAHGSVASFLPGLRGAVLTLAVESANGMALDEDVMDGKEGYLFGMASGVLFDLGAAVCLLGLIQMVVFTLIFLKSLIVRQWEGTPKKGGNASLEASLLWGALTLGFFFLLGASEYLDVGYQDPNRGIKGEQKQKNFCSAHPMKGRYRVLPFKPLSNEQPRGWICPVATLARILCDSEGQDTALVKRWGRWASDSFQTYVWEARETARGVAQKMITADLTPN
ncbi:tRNA 2'-phosphotransferase 1 [Durusdinium trenchii]|uniref:tRNA 2'-phosphotransferase 1 n=1 Tax=Durusdinium trenchii TaxID=1381693 RepID=A0ABP0SI78_9DINO